MAEPENIIPFAEGAPADELMIEELADGDVLIGDPELDMIDCHNGIARAVKHDTDCRKRCCLAASNALLRNAAQERADGSGRLCRCMVAHCRVSAP